MKDEYQVFARNLSLYMSHYGYNQTSLAKELSIAPATVAWWCHGERLPRFGKLKELTELFHCSSDDLLEKTMSKEEIQESDQAKQLLAYCSRLNVEGIQKVTEYIADLNSKYYKN